MSKNEKSFGFLDLIRTVLIFYILGTAIKMVYFDAPKAAFDYLFRSRMTIERIDSGKTFDDVVQALLFLGILLCLYFISWLAGISEIAVTALIISWISIFLFQLLKCGAHVSSEF